MSNKFTTRKGLRNLGDTELNGDVGVTGNVGITGNLTVSGTANLGGTTIINGPLSANDGAQIDGPMGISGPLSITGNMDIVGDVTVVGTLGYSGALGITGTFQQAGVTSSYDVDYWRVKFSVDGIVEDASGSSAGIQYSDDYSDFFLNNSLVTKKFVDDGFVAINQQDGVIVVDDIEGNDGTALPYRLDKPYKTIGAAALGATSGDVIFVRPGVYPESGIVIPEGVTVEGSGSWTNTFIGFLGATSHIFTMNKTTVIENVSLYMPAGGSASAYYGGGTLGIDRASLYSINFIGNGSTGQGVGMMIGGTGRMIGSDINSSTSGYSCIGMVTANGEQCVMTLDNLRFPTVTGGTSTCLFHVIAGTTANGTAQPRLQVTGLNVGSNTIQYVAKTSSSVGATSNSLGTQLNMFNVNCVTAQNFLKVENDGSQVGIYGGKINTSATGFDVIYDAGLLGTNAAGLKTTLQVTAAHQAK